MTNNKLIDPRAVFEALEAARFGDASDEQQTTLRDEIERLRELVMELSKPKHNEYLTALAERFEGSPEYEQAKAELRGRKS